MMEHRNHCFESRSGCCIVAHQLHTDFFTACLLHIGCGCPERPMKSQAQQRSCDQQQQKGFSPSHGLVLVLAASSAARTRSAVKGISRRRMPVASKMALPIAAGAMVMAVSPAPVAGTSVRLIKTVLTAGNAR